MNSLLDRLQPLLSRASIICLAAIAGLLFLAALFSTGNETELAADSSVYEEVAITPADDLLRGGREEWLKADSDTQLAAAEMIVRQRHPDLTGNDLIYYTGFLCGRLDLIYEQADVEQMAKTLDELMTATKTGPISTTTAPALSPDAAELLRLAAASTNGTIFVMEAGYSTAGSMTVGGRRIFGDTKDPRARARWEEALRQLQAAGVVANAKSSAFEFGATSTQWRVTAAGYHLADSLPGGKKP